MIILIITSICFFLFPQCKDSDDDGGKSISSVKITILPDKELIVEAIGGEKEFTITSEPSTSLKFAYSTSWIKPVTGKETAWMIEENKSELSRNGRIYILDASSLKGLDTIYITQKSVSGEINDNEVVFIETEVPVSIPFAGNSYISYPKNSNLIDNYTGKLVSGWVDKDIIISTYFRVGASGKLNIGFLGSNNTGTSKIRFTIEGESYDVTVSGPTSKIYGITTLQRSAPGYVKVDMQGLSKSGNTFGDISHFRIGESAASSTNNFVTEEKMAEDAMNCYFFRRGASTHFFYTLPTSDVEYFYNEILVTEENAVNATYYMMNGFSQGYMGIQQVTSGERKVLFSVWSPYQTDDPNDIPEEMRVKLLRKGANVTIGEFGNEGSGGQSWLNYSWEPGTTYKALVGIRPDGNGNSIYTAYFYADNEWKLIASFSRPQTTTYYKGAYSFLENFVPTQSIYTRSVAFKNQWVRLVSGEWKEITEAKFSMDDTGRNGIRYDVYGNVDQNTNSFVLKGFGFFDEHTAYGTILTRNSNSSGPPNIDFEALKNIPSID
ncbi:hypothetical protein GGR21_001375 [Dysgonomonas hofstadii]|uniref:DUF5077 domain-containing protein n=1 Tax=Dysgonomonas hofstadii TaxID=637886 RepID=A0A840CSG8_9BACT|nr:hypothetical protein [Dysgonomonas hofstadii]